MVAVLQRAGSPTQAEFHQVIADRADRWYAACLRITRDRHLAEDAVQDALLSAWNKRHQYEQTASLDTWIHRIAVNAALQLLRRQRPARWETLETDIEDEGETAAESRLTDEVFRDLNAALAKLTDIERLCFVLKHIEQWRLQEIAEHLDSNVGVIKQALFRALKKLRVSMANLRA